MGFITAGATVKQETLLSGGGHQVMEIVVPLGKAVVRGDAVNTLCDLTDGSDLFGIIAEDADGVEAETKSTVYVSGEFVWEGLRVKELTTKEEFRILARDKNIIIKELGGKE